MRYSQRSCTGIYVCTAILCWNSQYLKYTFFNITNCTPKPLYIQSYLHLTPRENNYVKINKNLSKNGFICSNCTGENFLRINSNQSNQCYNQRTKIKLINYCHSRFINRKEQENTCQCQPSNQSIEPITNWIKTLVKPDKSSRNVLRVNNINNSSLPFVYVLIGFVFLLLIFGGIIAMIFYSIKFQSNKKGTYK